MALSCEHLRALLDQDASLDTAPVLDHLAGCPQCRAVVDRWLRVVGRLREVGDETPPPPFLHGRVMAHVRARRTARARLWWAPAFATALVVVVVVWREPFDSSRPPVPSAPTPSSVSASPALPAPTPRAPQRPAVSPGPLRGISRSAPKGSIVCLLVRADGESRPVILDEVRAPAPDVEWAIVIAETGEVSPAGEAGSIPYETLEVLAASRLRPGRYLLRRASHTSR